MEQSFYKGASEEPASAATPALDVQTVMNLISSNPELFKKALEAIQFANNT